MCIYRNRNRERWREKKRNGGREEEWEKDTHMYAHTHVITNTQTDVQNTCVNFAATTLQQGPRETRECVHTLLHTRTLTHIYMNRTIHMNRTKFRYMERSLHTHSYIWIGGIHSYEYDCTHEYEFIQIYKQDYTHTHIFIFFVCCVYVLPHLPLQRARKDVWPLREVEYTPCTHLCCSV